MHRDFSFPPQNSDGFSLASPLHPSSHYIAAMYSKLLPINILTTLLISHSLLLSASSKPIITVSLLDSPQKPRGVLTTVPSKIFEDRVASIRKDGLTPIDVRPYSYKGRFRAPITLEDLEVKFGIRLPSKSSVTDKALGARVGDQKASGGAADSGSSVLDTLTSQERKYLQKLANEYNLSEGDKRFKNAVLSRAVMDGRGGIDAEGMIGVGKQVGKGKSAAARRLEVVCEYFNLFPIFYLSRGFFFPVVSYHFYVHEYSDSCGSEEILGY